MTARMHLLSVFALKLFSCRSFRGECKNKGKIVVIEGLSGANKGVKMIFYVSECIKTFCGEVSAPLHLFSSTPL